MSDTFRDFYLPGGRDLDFNDVSTTSAFVGLMEDATLVSLIVSPFIDTTGATNSFALRREDVSMSIALAVPATTRRTELFVKQQRLTSFKAGQFINCVITGEAAGANAYSFLYRFRRGT